ncbi:MAG: hypothetical protein JNL74_12525, partial [Fibrobacteres bacterium]|nr:hypothetical protein [Fibrobacterota bacterium]
MQLKNKTLSLLILIIASLFGETPLRFYTSSYEKESTVETVNNIPDSLECRLNDFMPHEAEVFYSINFCEMIKVKKVKPDGSFIIKPSPDSNGIMTPWLIEGVNRLTFFSKNRVGLSNRQS